MFIQTEPTPNPETLKFLPGQAISPDQPRDFDNAEAARGAAFLREMFAIEGVERVFLGADFIAVTKAADQDWAHLKPAVLGAIADALEGDQPLFPDAERTVDDAAPQSQDPIVKEIIEIIDTRVRPAVAQDGGDIVFQAFDPETGVVSLHMRGACAGCPSSTMTLKAGIENLLRHYVPEVTAVEAAL